MTLGCKTSKDVMKAIKDQGVEMVDIRFTDMPGMWQHISYPAAGASSRTRSTRAMGFDGSSIRGFKVINESDMLLMPDPTTAFIDPFMAHKTLVMIATSRTRSPRSSTAATRAASPRRPRPTSSRPASATPPISAPRPSSSSSTTCSTAPASTTRATRSIRDEGHWNTQPRRGPEPRLQDPAEGGLLPLPAQRHAAGSARRDGADHDRASASRSSASTTRSPPPASARST